MIYNDGFCGLRTTGGNNNRQPTPVRQGFQAFCRRQKINHDKDKSTHDPYVLRFSWLMNRLALSNQLRVQYTMMRDNLSQFETMRQVQLCNQLCGVAMELNCNLRSPHNEMRKIAVAHFQELRLMAMELSNAWQQDASFFEANAKKMHAIYLARSGGTRQVEEATASRCQRSAHD